MLANTPTVNDIELMEVIRRETLRQIAFFETTGAQ